MQSARPGGLREAIKSAAPPFRGGSRRALDFLMLFSCLILLLQSPHSPPGRRLLPAFGHFSTLFFLFFSVCVFVSVPGEVFVNFRCFPGRCGEHFGSLFGES